jgi:predicted ATPase/class 3 adenylate cyclase
VRDLPSGTVTFLFTDIEGSTRLLGELGDRYSEVLADHRRALREAIAANGGVEVDTQGDAFFVAFSRASDALEAAAQTQRALEAGPVRVRMGLHTGEPSVTDEGYVGMDVHRAARVMAAGHGGQVLLSQTTRELLDEGVELRDLGEHRLKDLSAPQRLFQLGAGEFPPLKTLHQTNLPVQPTPLVGREQELAEAGELLRENRLVTLLGPGGSGKTRLALQLAAQAVEDFEQGVYWVPLQAVADPELVAPAVAQAVGAKDGLADFLGSRRTLLLLDNLEQLLDSAPALADLLRATSGVKILATSREPLRLGGERRFPVDPLPDHDAVALFVERAYAVDPGFQPSPAVAEICRRLDGLPLALELAAARTSVLSAEDLLARLESALPLLTGGARDAPERQRTLRATIEWSHQLLDEGEQRLFRRLSFFAGSFDLDAATAVSEADLDTLQSLIDKSLVRRWGSGRYGMLETIQEYARERLVESGEEPAIGRGHVEHYIAVADAANLSVEGTGEERPEVGRLEQANFRAGLGWAVANRELELGLRLAAALENFWVYSDPFEGARWLEALMPAIDEVDPALRAKAFRVYGGVLYIVGEFERGVELYERSMAVFRELGDELGVGHMLHRLAIEASRRGASDEARRLADESLEVSRRLGDRKGEALALTNLGIVAQKGGDLDRAIELYRQGAERAYEVGFLWWEGGARLNLGDAAIESGRLEEAEESIRAGVAVMRRVGDRQNLVYGLALLARVAWDREQLARAGLLWGAVEAEEQRGQIGQWEADRHEIADVVLSRSDPDFERSREEGSGLSLDEAVERALSID